MGGTDIAITAHAFMADEKDIHLAMAQAAFQNALKQGRAGESLLRHERPRDYRLPQRPLLPWLLGSFALIGVLASHAPWYWRLSGSHRWRPARPAARRRERVSSDPRPNLLRCALFCGILQYLGRVQNLFLVKRTASSRSPNAPSLLPILFSGDQGARGPPPQRAA